jgi:hypothetical protein
MSRPESSRLSSLDPILRPSSRRLRRPKLNVLSSGLNANRAPLEVDVEVVVVAAVEAVPLSTKKSPRQHSGSSPKELESELLLRRNALLLLTSARVL